MSAPEKIWIEDEFGEGHEDQWQYGSWDCRNAYDYVHEYIRADIADARVAAAYEAAAQEVDCGCKCRDAVLAAETKVDRWYACAQSTCAAMSARDIRALTPDDAKATLEAVRREERQFGIPVAAALAAAISLLERGGKQAAASDKMFDQMLTDYQRALDDYRALIDKETTE